LSIKDNCVPNTVDNRLDSLSPDGEIEINLQSLHFHYNVSMIRTLYAPHHCRYECGATGQLSAV